MRVRLLRGAIAIRRDDTAVLPALARALVQNRSYSMAVAVVQSAIANVLSSAEWAVKSAAFFPDYGDRAALALELSRAYRELERPADAAALLTVARRLQPGAATDAEIAALRNEARLRIENRARMPVVTTGVRQPGLVRPRLLASAGGAQ